MHGPAGNISFYSVAHSYSHATVLQLLCEAQAEDAHTVLLQHLLVLSLPLKKLMQMLLVFALTGMHIGMTNFQTKG